MSILCPNCVNDNPDGTQVCVYCGSFIAATGSSTSFLQLPTGSTLKQGQYQIEDLLGEGGFGITYKGTYLANGAPVAIKELWPEKGSRQSNKVMWPNSITPQQKFQQLSKFKLEASHQQKCSHPNIAQVYDWFDENDTCYIVMQFISGKPLSKIFKEEGILQENRVTRYFIQITEALKIVHQNQFLHRDIKPDNIIIDLEDRAVLIDFGAAREFMFGQTGEMTQVLTPGYAPYEQYALKGKRYAASDFYSLFASMYEVLTGKVPVEAPERVMASTATDPLIQPRQLNPQISALMERAILIGMRIKVEERFQTADEALEALNGKLTSPLHRKAQEFVKQGQLLDAAQAYQRCLSNESDNGEAAIELALVEIYLNDDRAEIAAQTALRLKPNDPRGHGVLGLVYCRKNNWQAAVQHLQQAANLSPQSAWIQTNLGWALGKTSNWQQAESAISIALNIDSNSTFALGIQAWIAFNQQQYKPAIRAATQAISKTKQNPSADSTQIQYWLYPHLIMALDRVSVGQSADMERRIQDCLIQIPTHPFIWGLKGLNAAQQSDWNVAISSFQQAINNSNIPAWIVLNAALIYEHLGHYSPAIQIYQNYLQEHLGDFFIYYRLGTLFARIGQWQEARTFLNEAIKIKPDRAEAHHNLGWVLLSLKTDDGQVQNSREILSTYRRAISLYTQQNQLQYALNIQSAFKLADIDI